MSERIPARIQWAVDQLDLRTAGRVLEVGCGGGYAVALLCSRLPHVHVTAIDRSSLQVNRARSRNHGCIAAGRAQVESVSLLQAPDRFGTAQFTTVLAINVNAYWNKPKEAFAATSELLHSDGKVWLVYEPPVSKLDALTASLQRLFAQHGFRTLETRTSTFGRSAAVRVVGQPG